MDYGAENGVDKNGNPTARNSMGLGGTVRMHRIEPCFDLAWETHASTEYKNQRKEKNRLKMLFMFRRCIETYLINHKYHDKVERSNGVRWEKTFKFHYMRLYKFFEPIGEDAQMHDIKLKTLVEQKV